LIDPTHVDRSPSPQGVARARAVLAHRFPALKSAPLVESRVCQYENSPDGHLIIDRHPDAHNVWIAGGGSGHGFKLGPVIGEHLAKCILHHQQPEPFFSLQRLTRLKERSTQFDHRA
jgi:glycine/D-amino acid oxidase-like deaminating enzyme